MPSARCCSGGPRCCRPPLGWIPLNWLERAAIVPVVIKSADIFSLGPSIFVWELKNSPGPERGLSVRSQRFPANSTNRWLAGPSTPKWIPAPCWHAGRICAHRPKAASESSACAPCCWRYRHFWKTLAQRLYSRLYHDRILVWSCHCNPESSKQAPCSWPDSWRCPCSRLRLCPRKTTGWRAPCFCGIFGSGRLGWWPTLSSAPAGKSQERFAKAGCSEYCAPSSEYSSPQQRLAHPLHSKESCFLTTASLWISQ